MSFRIYYCLSYTGNQYCTFRKQFRNIPQESDNIKCNFAFGHLLKTNDQKCVQRLIQLIQQIHGMPLRCHVLC